MNTLLENFGLKTRIKPWTDFSNFPVYLQYNYEYSLVEIGDDDFILMSPKESNYPVATIKIHLIRLQELTGHKSVLNIKHGSSSVTRSLIKNRIPFIVDDRQAYLPFLGVQIKPLRESIRQRNSMSPAAQVTALFFIYSNSNQLPMKILTKALPYSSMTVSRACQELDATGLFEAKKEGREIVLLGKYPKIELFSLLKTQLRSPIKKIIYTSPENTKSCLMAGLTALASCSFLNAPVTPEYAVYSKNMPSEYSETRLDKEQVMVEVWDYDPKILGSEKTVDILSLALSLADRHDERIELELENCLNQFWRSENEG